MRRSLSHGRMWAVFCQAQGWSVPISRSPSGLLRQQQIQSQAHYMGRYAAAHDRCNIGRRQIRRFSGTHGLGNIITVNHWKKNSLFKKNIFTRFMLKTSIDSPDLTFSIDTLRCFHHFGYPVRLKAHLARLWWCRTWLGIWKTISTGWMLAELKVRNSDRDSEASQLLAGNVTTISVICASCFQRQFLLWLSTCWLLPEVLIFFCCELKFSKRVF